ncbi:hypothetical protein C6503_01395 [Candidatus Poribacteria bacterium]|nr:MAG: hypothetical protein C6503_01395 [Candidatus Poribacteria bacterium]
MVYFRSQYQCLFNLLTVGVLLGVAVVCGCSESENRNALAPAETVAQPISEEMVAEVLAAVEKNMFAAEMESAPQFEAVPMAPMLRLPTIAEVMAQLRAEFPGNVLDDDFTRIREIIASETYIDYLQRTYPQENQFQNFDEFWALASVEEARYMELLNKYFKPPLPPPTTEDVDVLHYMALFERNLNVRLYHGPVQVNEVMLEMMMTEPVHSWLEQRFAGIGADAANILLLIKLLVYHSILVDELQEEDREKIHALFVEHGTQKGFLWVALQEPVSLGYVLKDFTDVQVFRKWVDGEFSEVAWWKQNEDNEK